MLNSIGSIIAILMYLSMLALAGANWYVVHLLNKNPPDLGLAKHVLFWTGFAAIFWVAFILVCIICIVVFGHFLRKIFSGKSAIITIIIIIAIGVIGGLDLAAKNRLDDHQIDEALTLTVIAAVLGSISFFIAIIYYTLKMISTKAKKKQVAELKKSE